MFFLLKNLGVRRRYVFILGVGDIVFFFFMKVLVDLLVLVLSV